MAVTGRMFGRKEDLGRLQTHLDEVQAHSRGRLLAVQGRRQVGKSTLLTTFAHTCGVPHLYVTAIKNAPMHQQLANLAQAARQSLTPLPDADLLFNAPPTSWTDAFSRIALAAQQGPVVVVLDEFPWAVERCATLEGELQVAFDAHLEHAPVLIAIVGSDVAMMERLTEHDRPLYGRAKPIRLGPLNPAEIADAMPHADALGLFDAYLVTGGYPRLVRSCALAGAADTYVRSALADDQSDLVITARISLDAEFTDAQGAYRVLSAIGGNEVARPGFGDVVSAISDRTDREAAQTATTRALTNLVSRKRLIEVVTPAGTDSRSRLRRYRLTDPYLRFWFGFIERHVDDIARGRADLAVAAYAQSWSSWRGISIEPIVHEAMRRLRGSGPGGPATWASVGSWWNRDHSVEVDVVARDLTGATAVGAIKWRARAAISPAEVRLLANARNVVPGAGGAQLLGICPAGARAGAGLDRIITAVDLLTAWR